MAEIKEVKQEVKEPIKEQKKPEKITTLSDIKRYSDNYSKSYETAKQEALKDNRRFIRKQEYYNLKGKRKERVKVKWIKEQLEPKKPEKPSLIYPARKHILIASSFEYDKQNPRKMEYRLALWTQEPLNPYKAEILLKSYFNKAFDKNPHGDYSKYNLSFDSTPSDKVITTEGWVTVEFFRYNRNNTVGYKEKIRDEPMIP